LLAATAPSERFIGDKGYDADHLRLCPTRTRHDADHPEQNQPQAALPIRRRTLSLRNVIERTFCRLKDFRAIATRYDKTARNYLAGLCLITALVYWIN
jgi:transposase